MNKLVLFFALIAFASAVQYSVVGNYDNVADQTYNTVLLEDKQTLIVAEQSVGMTILDVSDKYNPVKVSNIVLDQEVVDVLVNADETMVFIPQQKTGITSVNIADLTAPYVVQELTETWDDFDDQGYRLDMIWNSDNTKIYYCGMYYLNVIGVDSNNEMSVLGWERLSGTWMDQSDDYQCKQMCLYEDNVVLMTSIDEKVHVWDVSNDAVPVHKFDRFVITCDGIANMNDEYIFIAMEDGVQVYDLTDDDLTFYDEIAWIHDSAHRLDISDDMTELYVVTEQDIIVLDITDPLNIVEKLDIETPDTAYGVQENAAHDVIYVADASNGIDIIDLGWEETEDTVVEEEDDDSLDIITEDPTDVIDSESAESNPNESCTEVTAYSGCDYSGDSASGDDLACLTFQPQSICVPSGTIATVYDLCYYEDTTGTFSENQNFCETTEAFLIKQSTNLKGAKTAQKELKPRVEVA